jgi:septum formation protein
MRPSSSLNVPLILASRSPRRKTILRQMGFRITVVSPSVDDEEAHIDINNLAVSLQKLAMMKATSVAHIYSGALVLGADTIVVVDKKILGKPRNAGEAGKMIRLLSGRTHQVYTGVALVNQKTGFASTRVAKTAVTFRRITAKEITRYLKTADYQDKAGAYGIQDQAMIFVDSIRGCFYNVMGLPVSATLQLIDDFRESKGTR